MYTSLYFIYLIVDAQNSYFKGSQNESDHFFGFRERLDGVASAVGFIFVIFFLVLVGKKEYEVLKVKVE